MNIEELAFKDRKKLADLNELDLLDIIEFLQTDRKEWINQFSKTHNESVEIQKENQQLKEEFIKYLENEIKEVEKTIKLLSDTGSCRIPNLQYKKHILEDTLQKYKEIIGE